LRAWVEWLLLIPTIGGSVFVVICLLSVIRLRLCPVASSRYTFDSWPPVTVLKPVYGLETNLRNNLRSACLQDYPEFQVVFSVQDTTDPAIPLLRELQQEFGAQRVAVAIDDSQTATNGKIKNLLGALPYARYDILVISDSDVLLKPDYLKVIVAPLADPEVGCVCTLYKAVGAKTWFEKLELLTLNADNMANIIFAYVTGASKVCLGASTALRRPNLKEIGGLESLASYLVEDYEMGRRIELTGKRIAIVPYFIDTMVSLRRASDWWHHQIYWDQNNRSAQPLPFFGTVIIRSVPFALLFAALRGDLIGLAVLGGALFVRLSTSAVILGWGLGDREGLRALLLLPVRDVAALISWFLAFTKRTVIWRGTEFTLTRNGHMVLRQGDPGRKA
jgi:ceramide glucosyltransferase